MVVATHARLAPHSHLVPPKVKVQYFNGFTAPFIKRAFSLRLIYEMYRYFKRTHFDVIHGMDIYSTMALQSLRVSRKLGIPSVITCHSVEGAVGRWKILHHPVIRCVKRADRVIAVCPETRDFCQSFGIPKDKIRIIPNGVDIHFFRPCRREERSSIRESIGIGDRPFFFAAMRITKRKGPLLLIEAFARVVEREPQAMLLVAGTGKDFPLLLRKIRLLRIQENVRLLGAIPQENLAKYMRACDAFVLPSYVEAFGIAILEAMASGAPVIATRTSGAERIIEDEKNGILVPIGDPKSLAEAMVKVINDRSLATKLWRNGIRTARRFTWENTAKQVLEVYKELCESNTGQ